MKVLIFLFLYLINLIAYAAPEKIEFWFLSAPRTSSLDKLLKHNQFLYFDKYAINNRLQSCTPMGDGCFDPQVGFILKSDIEREERLKTVYLNQDFSKAQFDELTPNQMSGKLLDAKDTSLIDCDNDHLFNIFCGSQTEYVGKNNLKVEVFIDISTSMRNVDYGNGTCKRGEFFSTITKSCNALRVKGFNTKISIISSKDAACEMSGNNNPKVVLDEILASSSRTVLLISDIDELSNPLMQAFIKSQNVIVKGEAAPLYADHLTLFAQDLLGGCL